MNRTRTSKNAKRLLVWLLLLTMVFGLLPMAAFADETVVEPVVSEEPVQETEPSSEPTEVPSEPTQEPTQEPEPEQPGNADVTIEGDEELEEAALTNNENEVKLEDEWLNPTSSGSYTGDFMKIFFLDCGRKYYSVDSIKQLIDNASAAGFNYIQLAVGNDGLRLMLEDMSWTIGGTTYESATVKDAIHSANRTYDDDRKSVCADDGNYYPYSPDTDELTQSEMTEIIAYAGFKGMSVIPCVNTPGHMNTILAAAQSLTNGNYSYNGSSTTIDVTNTTAVEATKALLQKYINYFKGQGCKYFNMGADEYANDKYTGGSMGFGNLQDSSKYSYYVQYVNQVADLIKNAGMIPMAFNDGIYFRNNTTSGTFDTDIVICYWSCGWDPYLPMPANTLSDTYKFKLINTHGDYYWVLGKGQCSAETAKGFNINSFSGSTVSNPAGAMFCIWADFPGAETEASVISKTADTIAAFGATLPKAETSGGGNESGGGSESGGGETQKPDATVNLTVGDTKTETQKNVNSENSVGDYNTSIVKINAKHNQVDGETKRTLGSIVSFTDTGAYEGVITDKNGNYMVITDGGSINNTKDINEATVFTVNVSYAGDYYSTCTIKSGAYYLTINYANRQYTLSTTKDSANFYYYNDYGFYNSRTITYNNGNWTITSGSGNARLYIFTKSTTDPVDETTITFEGIKPGTTTCKIGDVLYKIIVDYKQETVNAVVDGTTTVEGVSGELDPTELNTGVAKVTLSGNSLTINGVGEGNTSVIVGNTKYTIVVTKEDLKNVTPLPLEYWITNAPISSVSGVASETRTNNEGKTYTAYFTNIPATMDNIASAEGIDVLNNIAPSDTAHSGRTVDYWHCRMLDTTKANNSSSGTERQTNDGGDDDTTSGVSFTKIRYYNGKWEVYTENYEWVAVDTSKHELIAYYSEYIKVTDEVESHAADWGKKGDGSTSGDYLNTSAVNTISYQVVYEDTTTNPDGTTADALKSKTLCYGNPGEGQKRGIGTIILDETANYEIYKVTAETGAMTGDGETWGSYTVLSFTWDDNEETVWTEADGKSANGSVVIRNNTSNLNTDGFYNNLLWDENKESILIRIYVRAKATPDTLTVHYIDKTDPANENEFYSYNISVKKDVRFSEDFRRTEEGTLVGNTVVNINNLTQTVQYDLKQMKEIGAQYRYASFVFVDAKRGDSVGREGMDVYLYYTFNRNRTFVVDFGIPLVITPAALNEALADANITDVDVSSTQYAKITVETGWNIKYKLVKTLDKSDTFSAYYKGTKVNDKGETVSDEAPYTIEIIPASSVYYEESFATFTGGKNTAVAAQWTDDVSDPNAVSANQQLSALGSGAIYGNDAAYNGSSKFSLGNAKKVTITNDMLNGWTSDSAWPTATFTFEGTGFDVISLTSNTTAAIAVNLVGTTANGEQVSKKYMVNTYYGYKYNGTTEKWEIDPDSKDALYQIPVLAVKDLDYGKYTATIMPFYNVAFDMQGNNTNDFWLDAIRVYDPLGEDYTRYTADKEGYPQYIKLRDKVADGEAAADNDVLFIDGADKAKVENYKNYGPNNEVYLGNGQAISFKLPVNTYIDSIQIGAKSPNASNPSKAKMKVDINGTVSETEIGTATEMYYKISESGANAQQVTITNTGDAILSLTNIKITYSKTSTTELMALSEGDEQAAVAAVRALYAAPVVEPVEPFKPGRFETSWSSNVRKGSRAVLTVKASTDVDAIVVNGVTVTQFKTRTERIGYGWNAKRVTYREFSYMITADEVGTINIPVVAVSNELGSSAAYDSTLTVKPSSPIRDWIGGLFGRWF